MIQTAAQAGWSVQFCMSETFTTFSEGVKTEREILLQIKNLPIKSCFDMVFNFRNRRSFHQNKPKQICKSWKRPTRKFFLDFDARIFHRPPGPRTDRFDFFKFGPLPVLGPTSFGPWIPYDRLKKCRSRKAVQFESLDDRPLFPSR